jgi:hypothetical protein
VLRTEFDLRLAACARTETSMFNLAHTTAGRYAAFAQQLLDDQLERGNRQ